MNINEIKIVLNNGKINEIKNWLFEKTHKIDKPLCRLNKEKLGGKNEFPRQIKEGTSIQIL